MRTYILADADVSILSVLTTTIRRDKYELSEPGNYRFDSIAISAEVERSEDFEQVSYIDLIYLKSKLPSFGISGLSPDISVEKIDLIKDILRGEYNSKFADAESATYRMSQRVPGAFQRHRATRGTRISRNEQ
jgi:hypothetical protein